MAVARLTHDHKIGVRHKMDKRRHETVVVDADGQRVALKKQSVDGVQNTPEPLALPDDLELEEEEDESEDEPEQEAEPEEAIRAEFKVSFKVAALAHGVSRTVTRKFIEATFIKKMPPAMMQKLGTLASNEIGNCGNQLEATGNILRKRMRVFKETQAAIKAYDAAMASVIKSVREYTAEVAKIDEGARLMGEFTLITGIPVDLTNQCQQTMAKMIIRFATERVAHAN